MSVDEIITVAKSLPCVDQNRIIDAIYDQRSLEQQLTQEHQDLIKQLRLAAQIPIRSPYESYEAAAVLQQLLAQH